MGNKDLSMKSCLSNKNWSGPKSLHEMLNTTNEDILKFISEYKLNLLSPYEMSEEELFRILEKRKEYGNLDIETVQVINTHLNLELRIDEEKENMDMCKAMKELIEDGRNEGIQEGEQKAMIAAIKGLYETGVAIDLIAKGLKMSIQQVKDIINGKINEKIVHI